ncbi:MAG: hypothetical protein PHC40_08155 [Eubacteriales bacterium]|nr:hypothetical protein [Eubacteriales bacterium]
MDLPKKHKYDYILDLPKDEQAGIISAVTHQYSDLDPFGIDTAGLIMNGTVYQLSDFGLDVDYAGPFEFKTVFFAQGNAAESVRHVLETEGAKAALDYMLKNGASYPMSESKSEEPWTPELVQRIFDDGYLIITGTEDNGSIELIQALGSNSEHNRSLMQRILAHRFV